jgi:predicted secreted Zn-dependent protease
MRRLAAFGLLILSSPAWAEVTEKLVYTNYEAKAEPARSLQDILDDATPHREGDQIFLGMTDWKVDWRLEGTEKPDGKCRITQVRTELSVVIDLPVLIGGNADQNDQFGKLLPALRTHELGHVAIARHAAAAIDGKLRSLPEASGCDALKSSASRIAAKTLDEYKAMEIRYDVVTGHGKTQGAWRGE